MIPLNSSALRGVAYDPFTAQMLIWFHDRGPYTFYRVPRVIFEGLLDASSHGSYYHQNIRGRYTA
jgi:hypothetical protein